MWETGGQPAHRARTLTASTTSESWEEEGTKSDVKPGERIRLIKEAAESLQQRPWHEVQLTLREHGLPTYELVDRTSPGLLVYCTEQLEGADSDTLSALHDYLLGEDAAPGQQQVTDRPWGSNPVAVFISHRHEDAAFVGRVGGILGAYYGIDAFVAHNDIEPSKKWRDTIRAALASCHFMVAVIHENFHESQWCDQEIGWAMGRGIPVMPVRRQANQGQRRDGFLEEHQDLVLGPPEQYGSAEPYLARQIFARVLEDPRTRSVGIKALIESLVNSTSFDNTRRIWARIKDVEHFETEQLRRMEYAVQTNRQVFECVADNEPLPELVKRLVGRFEEPQPPDPWASMPKAVPPF